MIGKGKNRFLQLQRVGNVFRIVDDDIGSFCLHQSIITGTWLGARFAIGHNQNLKMWWQG